MIASSTFGMFSVSPVPRLTSDKYFKINFVDSVFPAPDSPLQKKSRCKQCYWIYNTVEPHQSYGHLVTMVAFIINFCRDQKKFQYIVLSKRKIKKPPVDAAMA